MAGPMAKGAAYHNPFYKAKSVAIQYSASHILIFSAVFDSPPTAETRAGESGKQTDVEDTTATAPDP